MFSRTIHKREKTRKKANWEPIGTGRTKSQGNKQRSIPTRNNGRKTTTKQLECRPPQILQLLKKDAPESYSFSLTRVLSQLGFLCLPTTSPGRPMKGLDTWKLLQHMYETDMYSTPVNGIKQHFVLHQDTFCTPSSYSPTK